MKRFRFTLEPLLDFRKNLVDLARKEYVGLVNRIEAERASLSRLEEEYRRLVEEENSINEAASWRLERELLSTYRKDLHRHMEEKRGVIERLERVVEDKRRALVESMRARKTVEIVKEKSLKRHRAEVARYEQKVIDDIASGKYVRSSRDDER